VVAQRASSILLYEGEGLWRRFDLGRSCITVQEVESKDTTRKERDF
jgi:hypothetical protein